MKKIATVIVFIIMLISIIGNAASNSYTINELNMTIDVPSDLITFTRDIDENDPNLKRLGLDAKELASNYNTSNIYLNSIHSGREYEIVVTKLEYDKVKEIFNFNKYTENELNELAKIMLESDEIKNSGGIYTDYSIYSDNQIKFIILNFTHMSGDIKVYSRQYFTIYNGQAISIALHSYGKQIESNMELQHKSIIDSIKFTKTLPNPQETDGVFKSYTKVYLIGAIGGAIIGLFIALISFLRKKRMERNW